MKCSIVIPSYNCAAFLAHAVDSAKKQNYANLEIVVVDDGSTDSTPTLMKFLAAGDARINYIRLPKNMGRSAARNIGNQAATGDFIMVLDADDIAYPDRAKLTAEKLKKGADFVHASCDYIDAIGSMIDTHRADVFNLDKAIKEKVNRMIHSACAYTKKLAMQYQYQSGEASKLGLDDWLFQIEAAMGGAVFEHLPAVVGAYRDLETGISRTRDQDAVEKFKTAFFESAKVAA